MPLKSTILSIKGEIIHCMASSITKRFIECYRDLRSSDIIRSDRQFCSILEFAPQSWLKILKSEREVPIGTIQNAVGKFGFNPEFLFLGSGEKFISPDEIKFKQDCESLEQGIIHIPVTAKAGYTDQINDKVYIENLKSYTLPLDYFNSGEFRSFEIEGDSMEPVLKDGEIIVCSRVEDPALYANNIKTGYVYVVVTNNDIMVKRVANRLKEEGKLQLISDNTDYPDVIVDKNELQEVWIVKIKISPFAHSRISIRQEMIDKYSGLQKTINEQSEIIARLNSVVEKLLHRNRMT